MRGSRAGISDGYTPAKLHPKKFIHSTLLEFLDITLSTILIAPLVVGYWRGTWDLMGHYLLTNNILLSPCISFTFGICGHLFAMILQKSIIKFLDPDKRRLTYLIGSRLYTGILGIVCVNHWRGAWTLTDLFTGTTNLLTVFTVTSAAVILLTVLKCLRNLCATPFSIGIDGRDGYFDIRTMFKTSGSREPGLYVLDCVFSVLIVGTLVVVAWRGVWVMFDIILYPGNKAFSAFGSLIIGYGIVAITFALQPIMRWTCDRLTGFCRLAVADIFLFLSFIGTVNVWRGVWMILDVYLLPENHVLSCWITHAVSFIILALLNCSNSVLVRGVYIDAEEEAGECVIFPIDYIRLYFQKERTKKQKRLLDALEKQDDQNFIEDKQTLITHNNIKIINNNNNKNMKQHFMKIDGVGSEIKPMLTTSISGKTATIITTTTTANEKHNLNGNSTVGDNNE